MSDVLRIYDGDFPVNASGLDCTNGVCSPLKSKTMADVAVAENRVKIQNAIKKMVRDYSTHRENDAAMIPAEDVRKKYL